MTIFHNDLAFPLTGDAPLSDRDQLDHWLARCLTGDERAYHLIYNRFSPEIYRLCYNYLTHVEDAEEVMQDAFEYAFRRFQTFDPKKSAFRTWLYRIAISRCRNKRRRKWLPTFSFAQLGERDLTDRAAPIPDDSVQLSERQQIVWEALQQLSPKLRDVALLRYYNGLTYGEIGEILEIPAKTAESRMRLGHKAMKRFLADKLEL